MIVILIGLRGAGKSTAGAALARRAGLPFIDLDDRTAAALGHPTAAAAFEAGEPAFRAAEAASLRAVLAGPSAVLALGGGTPTAPGAADLIRAARASGHARTLYLRASPATLRARLAATDLAARPSLTGTHALDEIGTIFTARDARYSELADTIIETDRLTPDTLAQHLHALLTTMP